MASAALISVCLIASLIGADRAAVTVARRRAARLIAGAWRTARVPDVRIGGPFLVQLLAGSYRQVRLTIPAFTVGAIEFAGLEAALTGVRATVRGLLAGRGLVAGEVTAAVAIPFATLSERLPPGFAFRRHGQDLRIHGWALAVPVSGTVEISADLRRISVSPRIAGIPSLVGFRIDLPPLPHEVTITAISVTDSALTVSLAGRDVRIAAAGTVDQAAVDQARRTEAG